MRDIVAACITGALGLLAGVLVGYKDEILRRFTSAKRSVTGTWRGRGNDISVPPEIIYAAPRNYSLTCQLKQIGTGVTGTMTINESTRTDIVKLAAVLSGDYVVGKYVNVDPNVVHYGQAILQLKGDGKSLVGFYLSVRIREAGMGFGSIEMERT